MAYRKEFAKQKTPRESDGSVIVGRNPVMELLRSGRDIEKLYVQRGEREGSITKIVAMAREAGIIVDETDKRRLDELADGSAHQGVAAIASKIQYCDIQHIIDKI